MEIKDQATATEAALNLDKKGSEQAPKPGEPTVPKAKSTSAKMFPEFIAEDGMIVNRPVTPFVDKDKALPNVAATPASAPAPSAPNPQAPTAAGHLDLSKLPDGTMVRIKVDGVEMDVTAKEALKNIQLERHLTLQGQKLAAERAALEAERAAMRQPPAAKPPEAPPAPAPAKAPTADESRIAALEAQIASLTASIAPQQFQSGLQKLAARAKEELGAEDFMTYAPKIQAFVDGELAKPEVRANQAALQALDSQNFWYQKYQEMKLRDVLAGKAPVAPNLTPANVIPVVAPISAPAGTAVVLDKNNNPVVVPIVEGADGVPSRDVPSADWQRRYQAAFETAKKTGATEDWQRVFALKRETPAD